jgi:hypothetical protein
MLGMWLVDASAFLHVRKYVGNKQPQRLMPVIALGVHYKDREQDTFYRGEIV